ncbi:MAG: ATP synthase F1 subunit delta [Acidaminobacteraceae bacterium]
MAKLVSKTYSESLFEVAVEENILDKTIEDMLLIKESFETYPKLYELFRSPQISSIERKAMLSEVFGPKVSTEVLSFLKILVDKGRCSEIFGINDSFMSLSDKHNGIIHVVAKTAIAMDEKEIDALKAKLSSDMNCTIEIINEINPEIMGGLTLKIGDKVIDGSVKKKLNDIRDELAQIIV